MTAPHDVPHPTVGCDGKYRYGAKAARRAARILRDTQGQEVRPYACEHCHCWHVGHHPGLGTHASKETQR